MAIEGVKQPDILPIDETLRLRRYDGDCAFALAWYQDAETLMLVDGRPDPYDMDKLCRMYQYLERQGELYFIELWQDGSFVPIGDVTFWQEDMPIVIGRRELRGRKIGSRVVGALLQRAAVLGYDEVWVREIYDFNEGSKRLFEGEGFRPVQRTKKGWRYRRCIK